MKNDKPHGPRLSYEDYFTMVFALQRQIDNAKRDGLRSHEQRNKKALNKVTKIWCYQQGAKRWSGKGI